VGLSRYGKMFWGRGGGLRPEGYVEHAVLYGSSSVQRASTASYVPSLVWCTVRYERESTWLVLRRSTRGTHGALGQLDHSQRAEVDRHRLPTPPHCHTDVLLYDSDHLTHAATRHVNSSQQLGCSFAIRLPDATAPPQDRAKRGRL